MFTQLIKQSNAIGVASNVTATVRIPTGGTHYAILLNFLGSAGGASSIANIKTSVTNFILRHNGEQVMEGSSTFFLDLQKYYFDAYTAGAANVAGVVPIVFAPYHFNNFSERQVFAVGTKDIQTMTLDIVCGTLAAGATGVTSIEVFSEVDPTVQNRNQYMKIKKFPQSYATTGEQEISTLPLEGASVAYKAFHIELGTNPGVASYTTLKVGNYAIHDQVKTAVNTVRCNFGRRTPQAAYTHLDLGCNNDILAFLPMAGVQDLRLLINWTTTPTSFNVFAEQVCGLVTAAGK